MRAGRDRRPARRVWVTDDFVIRFFGPGCGGVGADSRDVPMEPLEEG